MTRSRWIWLVAAVGVVLLGLWVSRTPPESLSGLISLRFPSVGWIDTATLDTWMNEGSPPELILLDARTPEEFAVSHLDGAVRVDPDAADLDSLNISGRSQVVVYCSVGYRSAAVAETLEAARVADVYNLRGGIFAWANEGRPIVRDGMTTNTVHPYDALWGRFLRHDLRWQPTQNEQPAGSGTSVQ